jgi:hypothetical protein
VGELDGSHHIGARTALPAGIGHLYQAAGLISCHRRRRRERAPTCTALILVLMGPRLLRSWLPAVSRLAVEMDAGRTTLRIFKPLNSVA